MIAAAKRFWKTTNVITTDAGWMIALDGRNVKTPAGIPVTLASQKLAEVVAEEWKAQEDKIDPATMPHFRYVVTAIDRVTPQRPDIISQLAGFSGNDMLCYRDPDQNELANEQLKRWGPLLDWADETYGIKLETGTGILPIKQSADTLSRAHHMLVEKDDFRLAGLYNLISLSGSFIIGIAIEQGRLIPQDGFELAFLDELWQSKKWGSDSEAENRRQTIKQDMIEATSYLSLLL